MRLFWPLCLFTACDFGVKITGDTGDDTDVSDTDTDVPVAEPELVLSVQVEGDSLAGYSVSVTDGMAVVGMPLSSQLVGLTATTTYRNEVLPPAPPDWSYTYVGATGTPLDGVMQLVVPSTDGVNAGYLCSGAVQDASGASGGGRVTCFRMEDVYSGNHVDETNAVLILTGDVDDWYGGYGLSGDVDGSASTDLILGGGMGEIYVFADPFAEVETTLPPPTLPIVKTYADAAFSFLACDVNSDGISESSGHCHAAGISTDGTTLAVLDAHIGSGTSYASPVLEVYSLPLASTSVPDDLVILSTTHGPVGPGFAVVPTGFAVSDPLADEIRIYADDLSASDTISFPSFSQPWGLDAEEIDGVPWLAVGTPLLENDDGDRVGGVVVFDMSAGVPADETDGIQVTSSLDHRFCGYSVAVGTLATSERVVAMGCYHPDYGGGTRGVEVYLAE